MYVYTRKSFPRRRFRRVCAHALVPPPTIKFNDCLKVEGRRRFAKWKTVEPLAQGLNLI